MSLDAINSGFAALRTDDLDEATTLKDLDTAQVASSIATALDTGTSNISADDIQKLITSAENLTIDQAIAYMYQMLSLVDTDSSTEDIEFDGSFEEALGSALGLTDTDDDGTLENEATEELGDIAAVFAEAKVSFEGLNDGELDNSTTEDDRIILDFSEADGLTDALSNIEGYNSGEAEPMDGDMQASDTEGNNGNTMSKLGFDQLTDDNKIISWGYLPSDEENGSEGTTVEGNNVGLLDPETGLALDQTVNETDDMGDNQGNTDMGRGGNTPNSYGPPA